MTDDGTARFTVEHPQWGEIKILRPVPFRGDRWGVLTSLRGTPWGDLIAEVSGEALSHALRASTQDAAPTHPRGPQTVFYVQILSVGSEGVSSLCQGTKLFRSPRLEFSRSPGGGNHSGIGLG